jgi:hypothetical protein
LSAAWYGGISGFAVGCGGALASHYHLGQKVFGD